MGGLVFYLRHPDRILRRIKILQCGGVFIELVAQHDHQVAQGGVHLRQCR